MERTMPIIPYQEVVHYLGCQKLEQKDHKRVLDMIDKVSMLAKPKIIYRVSALQGLENELHIPLTGNDIAALLKTCDQVAFLAATLGMAIDQEGKRLSIKDMGDMLVYDAVCNAAIEAVANTFQEELRQTYLKEGLYLSDRFSCGYGDLSISIQRSFCEALDTKRKIGVYVNASSLLLPLKSITAMIGISKQMQPKRISGCAVCDLKDTCALRKRGQYCGS